MRKSMFPEDIKQRMILLGVTNSQLSELTHATQAQLSLFFKKGSRASLKTEHLQSCFDALGIETSVYTKRYELAKKVAAGLKNKTKLSLSEVCALSKAEMAKVSGCDEVRLFPDVNYDEFMHIRKTGVIDPESTYPFFRTMVMHVMGMLPDGRVVKGKDPTSKDAENSLLKMAKVLGLVAMPAAVFSMPFLGGLSIGALLYSRFKHDPIDPHQIGEMPNCAFSLMAYTIFILEQQRNV